MKYKLVPQTGIDPLVWAEDRGRWQALPSSRYTNLYIQQCTQNLLFLFIVIYHH